VHLLMNMATESNQLPPSLFLSNIELDKPMIPFRRGGFAEVYRARHKGAEVALKRLTIDEQGHNKANTYRVSDSVPSHFTIHDKDKPPVDVLQGEYSMAPVGAPQRLAFSRH
jgi:hypothetical protein